MSNKVIVTLINKETKQSKQASIRNDYGLKPGKTWKSGAKVTVPSSWYDSIPEWTGLEVEVPSQLVASPTMCPHCTGTGKELSGEIFGASTDEFDLPGQIAAADTFMMSDADKRRLGAQRQAEREQALKDPAVAQQALQREEQRYAASGEGSCSHCSGTGKTKVLI